MTSVSRTMVLVIFAEGARVYLDSLSSSMGDPFCSQELYRRRFKRRSNVENGHFVNFHTMIVFCTLRGHGCNAGIVSHVIADETGEGLIFIRQIYDRIRQTVDADRFFDLVYCKKYGIGSANVLMETESCLGVGDNRFVHERSFFLDTSVFGAKIDNNDENGGTGDCPPVLLDESHN